MTAPRRRGWCPTLHAPMSSGDGLLVRVHPPGAVLDAAAARALADAAERHGVAVLELTPRVALQLRGLAPDWVAPLRAALLAAGLADPDPAREAAPPVLLSPLAAPPVDPATHPAAAALAHALRHALRDDPALRRLPPKALLAVDAGGALPLLPSGADLLVRPDAAGATLLLPGVRARCPADPLAPVLALLRLWAARCPDPPGSGPAAPADAPPARALRLRELDPAALLAAIGLRPEPAPPAAAPPPGHGIGAVPLGETVAVGVAPPLGRLAPDTLRRLAALAERRADGLLRLTPWRSVLLLAVPAAVPALLREAAALGLLTAPDHPLLRLVACPGSEGCASGEAPTLRDAARLAARLPPGGGRVHLSGCRKGCAHPGAATTLVGRAGRYDLVRHGRAGDAPDATGLTLEQATGMVAS